MTPEANFFGALSRRQLLAGAAAAALLATGGPLRAQTAGAVPGQGLTALSENFRAVSRYLTGHDDLDPQLFTRILSVFTDIDADFSGKLAALKSFIDESGLEVSGLAPALTGDKQPLSVFAQQIVRAWYVGVVGDGDKARAVTYTEALMNKAVADVLTPPGYAMGPYASWKTRPAPTLPF